MRIADGGGSTRPADDIIITDNLNILAENKRTDGDAFKLSMLEVNQQTGLTDFEATQIDRNVGMVFISFYNGTHDEMYGFRLVPALQYMVKHKRVSIPREVLKAGGIPAILFPLIDEVERTYDLEGVYNVKRSN